MSQEQPLRPQDNKPIKIDGDVFSDAKEELAQKPVVPKDAEIMQAAETAFLGHTAKGDAAAAMQSAATKNENAGLVGHDDKSNIADKDISITETDLPGRRIITEAVGGQVLSAIYIYIYELPILYIQFCYITCARFDYQKRTWFIT